MTSAGGKPGSRADRLRQAVAAARDDRARLAALLALARHFAELSDGVNGLQAARAARALALELQDWPAVAHALNSASVSQYHRSDYVGALATAIDAWDAARRGAARNDITESLYAIGLALLALGEVEDGLRIADKGLAIAAATPALREPHVRLVGLKAMLIHRRGRIEDTEAYCAQAVELARQVSPHLVELGHGNWGIALLRTAEQRLAAGEPPGDLLARAREHFEEALRVATAEDDVMRVADRLSCLGQVAFLDGRLGEAERLLTVAMQRSIELDYVRTAVMSARYLAKLHLDGGNPGRAIELLRLADSKARRGAPVDSRPAVKLMLAGALDLAGMGMEAERLREAARELGDANDVYRRAAAAEARKLAARVLAEEA